MRTLRCFKDHIFENQDFPDKSVTDWSFTGCQFKNCNFSDSILSRCQFDTCIFMRCNLSNIKLGRSQFLACDFQDCKLVGINWQDASSPIEVSFSNSILDYNSFVYQNFEGLQLEDCVARDVMFQECNLNNANFSGSNLCGSTFEDCTLKKIDLSRTTDVSINLERNNLQGAKLSVETALLLLKDSYGIIVR